MKKFFVLPVVLFSFLTLLAFADHPIFISMAEVHYKSADKRLEIAVKVYSDDLQKAISKIAGETIEIGTNREHPAATKYIQKYLRKNFKLSNNQKEIEWDYIGRELDRDEAFVLWVYLKVDKVRRLKNFKLYNNILIDYQEQQENKISFRIDQDKYRKFDTTKDNETVLLYK